MVLFVLSIFQEFNSECPRRPNFPNFGSYMYNLYLSFRDGLRGWVQGGGDGVSRCPAGFEYNWYSAKYADM